MTKFKLLFDDVNESGFAYYKPGGWLHRRGPSLFVNPTFVSSHFRGLALERTSVTLVETVSGRVGHEGSGMAAIRLLLGHVDKKRCAYYQPVGDDGRGPSLLINRTVSSLFRGPKPAKSLMQRLEMVSSAVGE